MSPLARTPSPTSASPSHPHNLSHQARSTSPLTLRGSSGSPHLATITPQTSPRPGSPLLRRALSPEHFQLGKQEKKVRRSSREERRSLGRQNSFELKGRHRKHDLYQGVRCVVEQESVVQRSRSTSLNETNSQQKLSPRFELRRRSEEYRRFVSLKSEPKDCAEENSEEAERDTKLWLVGLLQFCFVRRKVLSLSPKERATPVKPTNIRYIFKLTYRCWPHNGEVILGSNCPHVEAICFGRFVEKQST